MMSNTTRRGIENCVRTTTPIAFALVLLAPVAGLVVAPWLTSVVATVGLSQLVATLYVIPRLGDEALIETTWDVLTTDAKHAVVAGFALLASVPVVALTSLVEFVPIMTGYAGGVTAFAYWAVVLGCPGEMDVLPASVEADVETSPVEQTAD